MADEETPKSRHGGRRPGAGRPPGSFNALPLGTVKALRSLKWRARPDAPAPLVEAADFAMSRVVDVLMGEVDSQQAPHVLKAATILREEACGPLKKSVEVSGEGGGGLVVKIINEAEEAS